MYSVLCVRYYKYLLQNNHEQFLNNYKIIQYIGNIMYSVSSVENEKL